VARPRTQPRPRAEWGTITRDKLVSAALEEIRAGRYDELSIRSLAAKLDVAPMSVYRHVSSRDDLLGAVTDRLLAESWRPAADPADSRAWITEASVRLRKLLVTEPAAMSVYLAHPVSTPAALERMRDFTRVLEEAGLERDHARRAYSLIHVFTLGFSALQAGRSRYLASGQVPDDPDMARLTAMTSSDAHFRDGLTVMLDGLGLS